MMKLQPSLKPKKRYVLFQITNKDNKKFWKREVIDAIEQQLIKCFGVFMFARASPMIVKESFDEASQKIIIKVSHKFTEELKVAMTLLTDIKETPVEVTSISTSGILKKLKSKIKN